MWTLVHIPILAHSFSHSPRFIPLRAHMPTLAAHAENEKLKSAGALWNNYGYHLKMIANYSGARAAYECALKIDEANFGPDHPTVARDVNNLGSVMQDLGDLPGARAAFERALEIKKKFFEPDHPSIKLTQENLDWLDNQKT